MIPALIKYEKVLRSMRWLPIGLAMGAFLLALKETPPPGLPFFPRDFRPQYLFFPALFFCTILVPYLLAYGAVVRTSRFQMTLPIPSRDVWLSRVLACAISAWGALAFAAIVLVVGNHLQGQPWLEADLASVMLNVGALIGVGLVLTHMPRKRLAELPLPGGYILYLVLLWLGIVVVTALLSALPAYWAAAPAAVALALGAMVYRSLPVAFALVPREIRFSRQEGGPPASIGGSERGRTLSRPAPDPALQPSGWLIQKTILRILYNPVLTPLVFAFILIIGLRNSGYNHGGTSNLVFMFWTLVALSTILMTGAVKLHLLDPLPVSRKTVFGYLVLPGLLLALVSFGLGAVTGKGRAGSQSLVEYEERYYDRSLDVRIPLEFWEIGRGAAPVPLEPCCDKPHAAWSVSFFKGTDLVLYNPYHAPADSSPEFVAHQFSRATEAVYGRQIPARDLLDRYFERGPDGGTVLRAERFNLLDDYPGLKPVGWGGRLASVLAIIGIGWLVYLAIVLRLGHPRIMLGHVVLTILSVVFLLTMIWSSSHGYTAEWKLSAGLAIFVRHLTDALPGSAVALWVITLALIAACYLLARAQFGRMEITVKPEPK